MEPALKGSYGTGDYRFKWDWEGVTAVSMLTSYLRVMSVIREVQFKKFQPLLPSGSFYQKIQQTMKIQEIPRKSMVF